MPYYQYNSMQPQNTEFYSKKNRGNPRPQRDDSKPLISSRQEEGHGKVTQNYYCYIKLSQGNQYIFRNLFSSSYYLELPSNEVLLHSQGKFFVVDNPWYPFWFVLALITALTSASNKVASILLERQEQIRSLSSANLYSLSKTLAYFSKCYPSWTSSHD